MIDLRVGKARIVFTDRRGGVSRHPYSSANLSDSVGDSPDAVAENRRRLAVRLGGEHMDAPDAWVWMRQVHGAGVVVADGASAEMPEADAVVTSVGGLPLAVLVADCAPVALVGDDAVAAVHAGWAGLEQGVLGRAVEALRAVTSGPIHAVLGPCIHPGAYEFGADLLARLAARLGPGVAAVTDTGAPAFDIPAAVLAELEAAGIPDVHDVGVCTASSPRHFSYRRDGVTGRQAMVVIRDR